MLGLIFPSLLTILVPLKTTETQEITDAFKTHLLAIFGPTSTNNLLVRASIDGVMVAHQHLDPAVIIIITLLVR